MAPACSSWPIGKRLLLAPGTRELGNLIAGRPRKKVAATTFRSIKLPGFAAPGWHS